MPGTGEDTPLPAAQRKLSITFKSIAAPKTRRNILQEVHATVLNALDDTVVVTVPEGTEQQALAFLASALAVASVERIEEEELE